MQPQDNNSPYPYPPQQPGQQYDATGQYAVPATTSYAQMDYGYDNGGGSNRRKVLIIAGVALGVLFLITILAMSLSGGKKGNKQSSNSVSKISEVNGYETPSYKAAYPKGWSDISDNLTAKQLPILDIEQYNDVKISANGFVEDKQHVDSILYSGWGDLGITDDAVKTMAAQEASKQQLETSVKTTFAGKPEDICETANSTDPTFVYNGAKFVLEVTKSAECALSTDDQQTYGTKAYHYLYYFGIKNGKAYFIQLRTTDADWTINQSFYNDMLLKTLEPK